MIVDKEETILQRLANGSDASLQVVAQEILTDSEMLRILFDLTQNRAQQYAQGLGFVVNAPPEPLCLLVDFDVIRTFMEYENVNRPDSLSVRYLFRASRINYGIPGGAFSELLAYLEALAGGARPRRESSFDDPLVAIAAALGTQREDLDDPEVRKDLDSELDQRVVRLSRLLEIFESDRFRRVYVDRDPDDVEEAFSILQTQQDSTSSASDRFREDRTINDRRDAENLAAAVYSWRTNPEHPDVAPESREHLMLVTSTRHVVAAGKVLSRRGYSRGHWIVARPRQLVIPELLGFASRRAACRHKLRGIENRVNRLAQGLLIQLDRVSAGTQKRDAQFTRLVTDVGDSAKRFLADSEAVRIETTYQPMISLADVHRSQIARRSSVAAEHYRYICYFRTLDHLWSVVLSAAGFCYDVREISPTPPSDVRRYLICNPSTPDEASLLNMLVFVKEGRPVLWSAQWSTSCPVSTLVRCLTDKKWPTASPIATDSVAPLQPPRYCVPPTSDIWQNGVVVSTSIGNLGFGIGWLLRGAGWPGLELFSLQSLFENVSPVESVECDLRIRVCDRVGAKICKPLPEMGPPEIQEIRINLQWGDIVFDVVPPEHAFCRRVTVLAQQPHFAVVAHLYGWLGMRRVATGALERACERILARSVAGEPVVEETKR